MRLFSVAMTAAAIAFATAMAGPASAQGKTVKACQEEWRANKADFKAKGISEKAYVAQCRGGAATAQPAPTATPPGGAPAPTPSGTAKTAKACRDEWRANRDSYKAAHVSEKAYVEKCQAGQTVAVPAAPPAATPPATTTAAPPTTPTPEPAPAPRLVSKDGSSNCDGRRRVCHGGPSEILMCRRHRRVGEFEFADLSLRGPQELRQHEARSLHV